MLIKYIKSVLWRVAKRLSYIEDARCLKVNLATLQYHIQGPYLLSGEILFCDAEHYSPYAKVCTFKLRHDSVHH